ncbi:MAG: PEP-CTERM sorting domain-containing protein [Planctomycetes bacterium]|nr:PEP-CTERM sorting domain-containing protein [Planctomycetota bacterium]
MRYLGIVATIAVCLAVAATAQATYYGPAGAINLSLPSAEYPAGMGPYTYDIPAGTYDITKISFDYSYGNQGRSATGYPTEINPAFKIRRLNGDNTDSYLGSFDIYADSFTLNSDYGPYLKEGMSLGHVDDPHEAHRYELTLNRSNGLWDLAINGTTIDFVAVAATGSPQPNGDSVTVGSVVTNKFFSDESMQSGLNAIALGWATLAPEGDHLHGNAKDGVGGTGAYRLWFQDAYEGYVDNIQVTNVPEPVTMAGLMLGIGCLARYVRNRKR